jgi:cytoskeletal protein RodZ
MSSVGEKLAEERRRQGKSLIEVEQATRIRGRLLEALEKGDWGVLPSSAYVKGYIQSYAQYLEIPSGPLLAEYTKETAHLRDEHLAHPYIKVPAERRESPLPRQSAPPRQAPIPRQPAPQRQALSRRGVPGSRNLWWVYVLLLVVIVIVVAVAARAFRPSSTPPPIAPEPTPSSPSGQTSTSPQGGSPAATDKASSSTTAAPSGAAFALGVSVAEGSMSWVRVTVDGLKAYEGTLGSGQTRTWQVSTEAIVKIGKPDAVTVTRDGQTVKPTDTSGIAVVDIKASN